MKRTNIKHTLAYILITGKKTKFGWYMAKHLQAILDRIRAYNI